MRYERDYPHICIAIQQDQLGREDERQENIIIKMMF